jgi:hypothetical protein
MDGKRWRGTAMLLVPAVAVVGLIGCGHSASSTAANAAGANPFSVAKLRGALLTKVNGVKAAAPASTGDYASLAAVSPVRQVSTGVRVTPRACATETPTGLNRTVLARVPAAVVTFRVGHDGVYEMLVASAGTATASALVPKVPATCARYTETIDGKTFKYTVKESSVKGIGAEAHALNVRSSGGTADDMWSLVYRGAGFVGVVTVVGPGASEAAVKSLGKQAYAFAAKELA